MATVWRRRRESERHATVGRSGRRNQGGSKRCRAEGRVSCSWTNACPVLQRNRHLVTPSAELIWNQFNPIQLSSTQKFSAVMLALSKPLSWKKAKRTVDKNMTPLLNAFQLKTHWRLAPTSFSCTPNQRTDVGRTSCNFLYTGQPKSAKRLSHLGALELGSQQKNLNLRR